VFISNLQWWTTDAELEQLCAAYGRVRLGHGNAAPELLRTAAYCALHCWHCTAHAIADAGSLSRNDRACANAPLQVTSIRFIDDKACGKSRGMAIVEFAEADAASQCITGLNG